MPALDSIPPPSFPSRARASQAGLAGLLSAICALPTVGTAQFVTKLNDPLPRKVHGNIIGDYTLTPDGSHALYRAAQDTLTSIDLYCVPIDGSSEPIRLTEGTPSGSSAYPFVLSPDGTLVAFGLGPGVLFGPPPSLYVTRVDGSSEPVLLTPTPPPLTLGFAISPDNSRVVYHAGGGGLSGLGGVYSVLTDGSAAAERISPPLPYPQSVTSFQISSSGQRVVYRSDQNAQNVDELFSAPIDGSSTAIRISAPLSGTQQVLEYEVTPVADRVVYSSSEFPVRNVYSVPIDGSAAALKLNNSGVGLADLKDFLISPDGLQVALVADAESFDVSELFVVPTDGSSIVTKLSGPMVAGGEVWKAAYSPDGSHLVFLADALTDGAYEIFSVASAGGQARARLNQALPPDGPIHLWSSNPFVISPDSTRVVYEGVQPLSDIRGLYSAAMDGSQNRRISAPLPSNQYFSSFEITSSSDAVAYRSFDPATSMSAVWSVALLGGQPQLIAGVQVIEEAKLSPDGAHVLYRIPIGEGYELLSRVIDASSPAVRLNGELPTIAAGHIESFQVSPDEQRVVYLGEQEEDHKLELYSVPILGGVNIKLNGPLEEFGNVSSYKLSPDSQWAVFTARASNDVGTSLYAARLDGSAGPVLLSELLPASSYVYNGGPDDAVTNGFSISADSQWVVYVADQDVANRFEIYSAAIDGSGSPIKLNGPIAGQRDVHPHFRISRDSSWVVYMADQEADGRDELYSARIDGSSSSINLNPTLVPEGDVWRGFMLTADSTWVVYRADQDTNNTEELYSVPIDGSSLAIKLNGPLPVGGEIWSMHLSPNSDVVIYEGEQRTDGLSELFSVPVDGSQPYVRLNDNLPPNSYLTYPTISPNGARVVYRVYRPQAGVATLYSVPITGGAAPTTLNSGPNDLVNDYRYVGNGHRLAYVLYDPGSVPSLYLVPVNGSTPATALNGPGPTLGTFAVSPNAMRIGYVAATVQPFLWEAWLIDRGTSLTPVRMSQRLAPETGRVEDLYMTRDVRRFVYLAKQHEVGGLELFVSRTISGI